IAGTFGWTTPTNRPNAGTNSQNVTFTPTATNNYNSVSTNINLVVNKAVPVLTWTPSPAAGLTYPAPLSSTQLNATSTVVGNWSYNPTNGAVLNAGTNTLVGTFTPTDTANYTNATITNTVVVAKGSNNIIFGALPIKYVGDAAFSLTATASSGLTVTYTSSNPNVATVLGSLVTIMGEGATEITASQAGDSNWNAATSVTQTLTVQPALNRGLVAYYPFNGNANDESGNGRNGAVTNAVLTLDRTGTTNRAYQFNGSNSRIVVSGATWPGANSDRSVVVWCKPVSMNQNGNLFTFGDGTRGNTRFSLLLGYNTTTSLGFVGEDNDQIFQVGNLANGAWHQLAITMNAGTLTVYLNGVALPSFVKSLNTDGSMPLVIGANSLTRNDEFFNGSLDELRVYSRALSATEISQLYQADSFPVFTSSNSFSGTVGVAFSNTVTASGAVPITFTASNLPSGLTLGTNGVISGTPKIAATNTVIFTASNSFATVTQTNQFIIQPGAPVILSFTNVGSTNWAVPLGVQAVDVLVVGGG
ncbi:MAG: LamG domain-containing protein, partial [Verrucomicrobia bacterium]|nr:LamG domain-containing protein [Verrucomicrobiota bacterium]